MPIMWLNLQQNWISLKYYEAINKISNRLITSCRLLADEQKTIKELDLAELDYLDQKS